MLYRCNNPISLVVSALLLCFSLAASGDEMQDASKLFKLGQHSQALSKVNTYLANKPKDAQARFLKGLILTEQSEITDAINIFSSLTEDYPELPEPYNNLAVLYAGQGQYDNAKLALEMAIRTHPSYATAHENLGDIYAKMASQAYDRALQLDRSNTATLTKLAMIKELFAGGAHKQETDAANPVILSKVETAPTLPTRIDKAKAAAIPAKAAAQSKVADHSGEVLQTVNAWAAAWSAQDTSAYLSFYSDDFEGLTGAARTAWESERSTRVSTPKYIQVSISNANIQFADNDHATVKFRQSYRASHLKISGKKTLQMIKINSKWLIQEEHSR